MDASSAVYYPFSNDDNDQGDDPKRCSVRGCTQLVTDGSQNKMCDSCRGRHRIYASTKRARRKLEKAAVANTVATRNGHEPLLLIHETVDAMSMPAAGPSSWVPVNGHRLPEEISSTSSHQTTTTSASMLPSSWNHAIDPRLFSPASMASSSHHISPHQTSSSSELANALTLPTPRPVVQPEQVPTRNDHADQMQEQQELSPNEDEGSSTRESSQIGSQDTIEGVLRFCSVKGCKAALAASYGFKMCPTCRTRYRTYGHTKRAKWKTEREVFDHEMAALRTVEDERRKANGLGPLADNPDELRAWELSIIDEQVPLPLPGHPAMASLSPPMNGEMDFSQHIASGSMHPPNFDSPMVTAGVYPATVGSIDTPHSVSPYPHLNNPLLTPMTGPIAARMCTVSHCHKILPGYYRYKRCEQHRMQNRYHSNLKRVREKQVKAAGVENGAEGLVIVDGISGDNVAGSDSPKPKPKKVPKEKKPRKERKDKGKPRDAPTSANISGSVTDGTAEAPPKSPDANPEEPASTNAPPMNISIPNDDQEKTEVKPREKIRKPNKYSCATDNCYNLLTPGVRWRTCEDCRDIDRQRKFEVRAQLKAAENDYWKGVAKHLSTARRAEEGGVMSAVGGPVASGSGSGDANGLEVPPDMVVDADDTDADGDSESGDQVSKAQTVPETTSAVVDTYPTQLPTWRSRKASSTEAGQVPIFNSLTKEDYEKPATPPVLASGFSKFRVELPPPALAAPTTSQTMDGPLTFKGFKATSTTAAIGRILASNPSISVDVFTNLLGAQKQKSGAGLSELGNVEPRPQKPCHTAVVKPVPTPTVPTSEPFVYKSPVKKPAPEEKPTDSSTSTISKGKRKAVPQKEAATTTSTGPATMVPTFASAPPTSFAPYGYPPSYPYYPYYMPPYPMPQYAYPPAGPPEQAKKGSSRSTPSSTPATPAPTVPHYYQYPYPPQAYGHPPPPAGYPYLPPRYTTAAYGPASGHQPYPGLPPPTGTFNGYPYYLPPSGPSVSAPPMGIPVPAILPNGTGDMRPPTSRNSQFNHYQYKSADPEGSEKRKKRRKMDSDYLEKYEAQTQAISMSLAKDVERLATTSAVPPLPPTPSIPVVETTPGVAPPASPGATNEEEMELTRPEASESEQSDIRLCATKTCHRKIPADVTGTICEKCKLRFKKHQAKTKQKFKLEPRKFVLGKSTDGKREQFQDRIEVEPTTS